MGKIDARHRETKDRPEKNHEGGKSSVCSWARDSELLLGSQGHFQRVNLKASGQNHAFSRVNMENPHSRAGN